MKIRNQLLKSKIHDIKLNNIFSLQEELRKVFLKKANEKILIFRNQIQLSHSMRKFISNFKSRSLNFFSIKKLSYFAIISLSLIIIIFFFKKKQA